MFDRNGDILMINADTLEMWNKELNDNALGIETTRLCLARDNVAGYRLRV